MKKNIKIFLIVLVIIIAVGIILLIDFTRIVEKANDKVLALATSNPNKNPVAYSIDASDDKVVFTMYSTDETVSASCIFNVVGGKVKSTSYERHYKTKLDALIYGEDLNNRKIKGNVVYGVIDAAQQAIGKDVQTLISELEETYNKILVRI